MEFFYTERMMFRQVGLKSSFTESIGFTPTATRQGKNATISSTKYVEKGH